jgi:hypothetical protein
MESSLQAAIPAKASNPVVRDPFELPISHLRLALPKASISVHSSAPQITAAMAMKKMLKSGCNLVRSTRGSWTWLKCSVIGPPMFFRQIHLFFVVDLASRRIIHIGVTAHPTDAWIAQQLRGYTVRRGCIIITSVPHA